MNIKNANMGNYKLNIFQIKMHLEHKNGINSRYECIFNGV